MAFDVMQYVKKIVDSKPAGTGNYIRDGGYTLAIRSLQIKPSDKGGSVWFIGEFMVLASAPVDVAPDLLKNKPNGPPNAVGSDCSVAVDLNSQMGPGNVKSMAAAVLNVKHDQITEEMLSSWINQNVDVPGGNPAWKVPGAVEQPLRGVCLGCKTARALIKSGKSVGEPIVRLNWDHVPMTAEQIAGARQMLAPKAA